MAKTKKRTPRRTLSRDDKVEMMQTGKKPKRKKKANDDKANFW